MQFKKQGKHNVWLSLCGKYHIEQRGNTEKAYFVCSLYVKRGEQYQGQIGKLLTQEPKTLQAAIFFCEEFSAPVTEVELTVKVRIKHRGGEPMDVEWAKCLARDRMIEATERYNESDPDPAYAVAYDTPIVKGE